MARGWIEKRYKNSFTLVIDEGIDPDTGVRKRWSKSIKVADENEAKAQLDIILGQIASKTHIKSSPLTIKQYFEEWLATVGLPKLATKTYESYKNQIDHRISPWIGHIKLCDLTEAHLISFFNKIYSVGRLDEKNLGKPIQKDTVEYCHRVVRSILNHAVKQKIISHNVAQNLTVPEPPDYVFDEDEGLVKVFSSKELATLERHLSDTPYHAFIATALRTGMRRGEILALKWNSINFEGQTIFVKRSLIHTKTKGYEYKTTKNKKRRVLSVTKELLNILLSEKEKQDALKLKLGDAYQDNGLVFCREDGQPLHPDTITSWFPNFCVDCGVTRLNFHCLRHTHASHLLAERENIEYVSLRLGHYDTSITYQLYSHLIPQEPRESLENLELKFRKSANCA